MLALGPRLSAYSQGGGDGRLAFTVARVPCLVGILSSMLTVLADGGPGSREAHPQQSGSGLVKLSGLSPLSSVGGPLEVYENDELRQSVIDAFIEMLADRYAGTSISHDNDESC